MNLRERGREPRDATSGGSRRAGNERETRGKMGGGRPRPGRELTDTVTTTTQPHSLTATPRSACHTRKKATHKWPKRSGPAGESTAVCHSYRRLLFPRLCRCRLAAVRPPAESEADGSRRRRGAPRPSARAGTAGQQAARAGVGTRRRRCRLGAVRRPKKAARRVPRGRVATPGTIIPG